MTIREFFNNGPEIQGKVIVKNWSFEKNEYLYEIEAQNEYSSFNYTLVEYIGCMDMEIKYIYPENNALVLEVIEEDD